MGKSCERSSRAAGALGRPPESRLSTDWASPSWSCLCLSPPRVPWHPAPGARGGLGRASGSAEVTGLVSSLRAPPRFPGSDSGGGGGQGAGAGWASLKGASPTPAWLIPKCPTVPPASTAGVFRGSPVAGQPGSRPRRQDARVCTLSGCPCSPGGGVQTPDSSPVHAPLWDLLPTPPQPCASPARYHSQAASRLAAPAPPPRGGSCPTHSGGRRPGRCTACAQGWTHGIP